MAVNNNFPKAPKNFNLDLQTLRALMNVINILSDGKLNCTGQVKLTASSASTVVSNPLCTPNSFISLTPLTANAASAIATTHIKEVDMISGQFTITHANNAQTDKDFRYVIIG